MEFYEPIESAPNWFKRNLAVACTRHEVIVAGTRISYLGWGRPGNRGLVFVHGGAAHARWWTHIAASFASEYRVIALDLSGHGDSDHAQRYSFESWGDQILAVIADSGIDSRPVIVGHSMGGLITMVTAATHPDSVAGVIICDSPVAEPEPEVEASLLKQAFGVPRTYGSIEEALARFRTVPAQEHYLDYVIDYVARHSLRPVDGGVGWKFDPHIFDQFEGAPIRAIAAPHLPNITARFALLRSEYGLVTPDIGAYMYEGLGRVATVVELPEAGHHPMLDQPTILLTAIRTLLADWDHSEPHRRV